MKYVITGSLGNISRPLVSSLLNAGHEVIVITSHAERKNEIEKLGARAAVGSLEDQSFVTNTFKGADAVYLMIPPNMGAPVLRDYQNKVADIYVNALKSNGIKYAVTLSSIGAHLGNGAGPVDGLADMEKKLDQIKDLNLKHLRPSYFYANLLGMVPLIKAMNIMGTNFGNTDEKLVLTDTGDIAGVAAEELLSLKFKDHSVRYIASDECHPTDIAAAIGKAIGKPELKWICFTDAENLNGLLQAGLPKQMAEVYTALGKGIREGKVQEDYWKNQPKSLGKVKLKDFAAQFAAVFGNKEAPKEQLAKAKS